MQKIDDFVRVSKDTAKAFAFSEVWGMVWRYSGFLEVPSGGIFAAAKNLKVWNIATLIESLLPLLAIYWGYILNFFCKNLKVSNILTLIES